VVIYLLQRYAHTGGEGIVRELNRDFFTISIVSLVVILLTGIGRTVIYRSVHRDESDYRTRKIFLILKHIAGVLIYAIGTYWQYRVVF